MEVKRNSLASFFGIDQFAQNEDICKVIAHEYAAQHQWWYAEKDFKHDETVLSASFHKDGTKVLTSEDMSYLYDTHKICIYDTSTGTLIKKTRSYGGSIFKLMFNYEGTKIIENSRDRDRGRFMRADYDISLKRTCEFDNGDRYFFCFNKTDTEILEKISDVDLWIRDVKTGRNLFFVSCVSHIFSAQFNHQETEIITMAEDGTLQVWSKEHGTELLRCKHDIEGSAAYFNQAGNEMLAYGYDCPTVYIHDRSSGEIVQELQHPTNIHFASFNEKGNEICTVTGDNNIRIWDRNTGKVVAQLYNECCPGSLEWNSLGTKIVVAVDKNARIWARYDTYTLPQILLNKLFHVWLLIEKPHKIINAVAKLLNVLTQISSCDRNELEIIWLSFPKNMQEMLWESMKNKIQKYGK